MPLYIAGAVAECFHCHAKVNIRRLTLIPTTCRRPPLPKKWAYFQEELVDLADQYDRPRDEVFCPKHFPSKGWRRLDDED